VKALRLVSQALDAERQTTTHSRALAAGWTAIREADDFAPAGSRLEADLNLPSLIRAHRTPVLKDAPVEMLAPLAGLRSYLTFAQEQLATAGGEEVAGSMALHGLGNLHRSLAASQRGTGPAATSKAMVFYQAALLATPRNSMASNELACCWPEVDGTRKPGRPWSTPSRSTGRPSRCTTWPWSTTSLAGRNWPGKRIGIA